MANTDPATLTSSAQIFSANHTLPQIRAIHKNIHVQIDEKAARLRTQVGSSYRDLLGTADTIVHMRGDNADVQELLGQMGGRCGRDVIGRKASGLAGFAKGQERAAVAMAARLRLLDASLLLIGRILKGRGGLPDRATRGDRLVLATKVLVLTRLLMNNLAEEAKDAASRSAVEAARATYRTLRDRLSSTVDRTLEKAADEISREDVLKALSAYSLATSKGAKDVLWHFLKVRGEAISLAFEVEETERTRSTKDVVRGLQLFASTLLDVQALVPAKLSQTLSGLKSRPLLVDTALQDLEGLRLDIFQRWCGEEIQYYTPFIRHDDLDGQHARGMLSQWLKDKAEVLLDGLRKTLDQMSEFKSIMELRSSVLELWIRDGGKARGIDPSDMQDELRQAINARMLAVLDAKVSKLRLVGSQISSTLATWKDGITDDHAGLWDEEGYDELLEEGAAPFVQEVVSRLYGRNDAVSKAANSYKSWYHVIDDVMEVVGSLRRQRWDNDYDEIEDEETIEARQQLLSKEDPQTLQERLDVVLVKSFKDLDEQIQGLWKEREGSSRGTVAMYFLRVVRDIRRQLPDRPSIKGFGLTMVPSLHQNMSVYTSKKALQQFKETVIAEREVTGLALWEGEPSLPTQPSPEVFQFLRALSHEMGDAGMDLWTKAAVKVMKQHLTEQVCKLWLEALEETPVPAKEEKPSETGPKQVGKKGKKKNKKQKKTDEANETNKTEEDGKAGEGEEEDKKEDGDETEKKTEGDSNGQKDGGQEQNGETKKDASDAKEAGDEDNDDEAPQEGLTEEQKTKLYVQWVYDVAYLRKSIQGASESDFSAVEDRIYTCSKLEDAAARQRMVRSANDYWQRTSLLFGLLA